MDGAKVFALLTLSINFFVLVTRCYYHMQQQNSEQLQQQQEEKQEQEEKKVEQDKLEQKQDKVCPWAELERDVLGEIVSRLCVTDQARFRAVCTNWLAAAHPIITNANPALPWHGCKHPVTRDFQIYDPLSSSPNHLASRYIIPWSQFNIPPSALVSVLHVQQNWLLLCLKKNNLFFWTSRWVLMFCPFTKRIISLPKFDYPRGFSFVATFSTLPDSQDCVFCMVDAKHFRKIAILTYRNGDKEWTAREFNRHPDFPPGRVIPHIIRGILYFFSIFGQVASYNILNGEFNFDRLLKDEFLVQNLRKREIRSFVLNEELMILCYNRDVKHDATLPGQQFIRRYDPLLKVWIPVKTLADYALFLNTKLNKVLLINTKNRTCNGVLPNKVYRFFNGGCLVYSLEDGQLVQFKSVNSNLLEDGGDNLPECKYNYATPDTRLAYWLEAPCLSSSSDNQEVRSLRDEGKKGTVRALR